MKRAQKVKLSLFREDPDNVSVATDEEIQRLAGKLKRVPLGLTAMRIAYVTDAPGGGRMVISGNKRLRCLKAAYGEDGEVPAEWFQDITAMSETERHEFRINANISDGSFDAEKPLAQYDRGELAELMSADALQEILDAAETDEAKDGQTDADAVPEAPETPVSKRGEVYQCGEHRLMCGDSTSADDVAQLMGGGKADMVFTDPPYGVSYTEKNEFLNRRGKAMACPTPIQNDEMPPEQMHDFWVPAFKNLHEFTNERMCYYITAPQGGDLLLLLLLLQSIREAGFMLKHQLIWNKNNHVLGRCDYDYKHEPIVYGWKIGGTHKFYGGGQFKTSVWDIPKPNHSKLHPTMKPVALVENAVLDGTESGMLVLDAFLGSGTTVLACEKTGRVCYGMELDPHYCDVIRKRWAEFTHGEGCDWQALTPCAADLPRKEGK